jgi:MoaA/NifB/PqqE/SkfB family radical SAM enzyme
MCSKGNAIAQGKDFIRDDLYDIARQQIRPVFPHLKEAILFGDGEPMVYRRFWELVEEIYAASNKCSIDLINNGSMMHAKNRQKLLDYKVAKLGLSIGGASAKSHNFCRPPGHFDRIVENYKALNEEKRERKTFEPYITLLMVVMKCNYKELVPLVELAHALGIYKLELQSLHVLNSSLEGQVVTHKELEPYIAAASKRAKQLRVGFLCYPLESGEDYNVRPVRFNPKDRAFQQTWKPISRGGYCKFQQPWNTVYVLHNGVVVPDCHWWQSNRETDFNFCGMLTEDVDILDIWNNPTYQEIRKRVQEGKILPQCRGCGLAGGVVDRYRCEDTDHADPRVERDIVQLTQSAPLSQRESLKDKIRELSSTSTEKYLMLSLEDAKPPEEVEATIMPLAKRQARNALVLDFQPMAGTKFGWAVHWARRVAPDFKRVFLLPVHSKKVEYPSDVEVIAVDVKQGPGNVNYHLLNRVLSEHSIDISFQHANFSLPHKRSDRFRCSRYLGFQRSSYEI